MILSLVQLEPVGREGMRLLSENSVASHLLPVARQLLLNIGSGALARALGCQGDGCSILLLVDFWQTNPE